MHVPEGDAAKNLRFETESDYDPNEAEDHAQTNGTSGNDPWGGAQENNDNGSSGWGQSGSSAPNGSGQPAATPAAATKNGWGAEPAAAASAPANGGWGVDAQVAPVGW